MTGASREKTLQSRDGRAVLKVSAKEYGKELSEVQFYNDHRKRVIALHAHSSKGFDIIHEETFYKDSNFRHRMAWILQSNPDACSLDMVDIIFRSRHFPAKPYGYVLSLGFCDEYADEYRRVRERILDSFQEAEPESS